MASHPRIQVPLGGRAIPVEVPAGWRLTTARPAPHRAIDDLDRAAADALSHPLGGPSLAERTRRLVERSGGLGRTATACVVVTDATRSCPDDRFLPPLLREIETAGIARRDIIILVATGLHRASTQAEKRRKLGRSIVERYHVVDHDAGDHASIEDLGYTSAGIPITINRVALEADLVVSTGVVEPHQYAGFSGGAKTVAIGVAGEATIAATHGIAMLDKPGVRLGRLDDNPFHDAVAEIGRRVGLDFVVNVVLDEGDRPLRVAAGEPEAVQRLLASVASDAFTAPISGQADVAVAGVPAPKDANLYQATRALTYLHGAATPAVRPGGVYIVPATIPEGAGEGVGERRFLAAMRDGGGPHAVLDRLRREGARGGEQRAYLVARVMTEAAVIVVGAERPDVAEECGMKTVQTLEAGLAMAGELARATLPADKRERHLKLLVVPDAIRTLPVVSGGGGGRRKAGGYLPTPGSDRSAARPRVAARPTGPRLH